MQFTRVYLDESPFKLVSFIIIIMGKYNDIVTILSLMCEFDYLMSIVPTKLSLIL